MAKISEYSKYTALAERVGINSSVSKILRRRSLLNDSLLPNNPLAYSYSANKGHYPMQPENHNQAKLVFEYPARKANKNNRAINQTLIDFKIRKKTAWTNISRYY